MINNYYQRLTMITKQVTIRPHSKPAWTNRRSNEDPRQFWVKNSSWQGAIKLVRFKIKIQDLDGDEIMIKITINDFSEETFSRLEVSAVSRVVLFTWGWVDWKDTERSKIVNKITINIIFFTTLIAASANTINKINSFIAPSKQGAEKEFSDNVSANCSLDCSRRRVRWTHSGWLDHQGTQVSFTLGNISRLGDGWWGEMPRHFCPLLLPWWLPMQPMSSLAPFSALLAKRSFWINVSK